MFDLTVGILYAAFLAADSLHLAGAPISNALKYAGLLLCLGRGCAQTAPAGYSGRRVRLLRGVLCLAAAADIFLLSGYRVGIGLILFAGVQCCYGGFWISEWRQAVRFGAAALLAGGILSAAGAPAETVLAGMYAALLVQNAAEIAARSGKRGGMPAGLAPAVGLLLLCDLHVGLYNALAEFRPLMSGWYAGWYEWIGTAMWAFYLPSLRCVVRAAQECAKDKEIQKRS